MFYFLAVDKFFRASALVLIGVGLAVTIAPGLFSSKSSLFIKFDSSSSLLESTTSACFWVFGFDSITGLFSFLFCKLSTEFYFKLHLTPICSECCLDDCVLELNLFLVDVHPFFWLIRLLISIPVIDLDDSSIPSKEALKVIDPCLSMHLSKKLVCLLTFVNSFRFTLS